MEKSKIVYDILEIAKKTTPTNATRGTKHTFEIDFSYWKQIETLLKNLPTNKYLFMPREMILQKIKSQTTIPSNFGYFITNAFVEHKLRIHIGYEKITTRNIKQIQNLKSFEDTKLQINDVVAKMSYITDNDIKQLKRKSYKIFQ